MVNGDGFRLLEAGFRFFQIVDNLPVHFLQGIHFVLLVFDVGSQFQRYARRCCRLFRFIGGGIQVHQREIVQCA